jgi:Response regulator
MSPSANPSSPDYSPCIAIVDDDEAVREALGNLLRSVGFEVRAFASAEAFLGSPERQSISCLVTDIQMPGMGGLELQQRVARSGSPLPVILMTAFPRDHVRRQAEEQGAAGFLAKPFDATRMIECVQRALQLAAPG